MNPPTSRHPFGNPLRLDALEAFCHPRNPCFRSPFRDPATGDLCAANGWLAVRLQRGPATHDDSVPTGSPDALARLAKLPWASIPAFAGMPWVRFDEERGRIYAGGSLDLWQQGRINLEAPAWTAEKIRIPKAFLQLLARLPAAELCQDGDPHFLRIRFTGGVALVPDPWRHARRSNLVPPHTFAVFTPRNRPTLPGSLLT